MLVRDPVLYPTNVGPVRSWSILGHPSLWATWSGVAWAGLLSKYSHRKLVSSTYSDGDLEGVRPPGFGRPGGAGWIPRWGAGYDIMKIESVAVSLRTQSEYPLAAYPNDRLV